MTNSDRLNPSVEQDARRVSQTPALGENLLERILSSENVLRAWEQVRRNHGAAGVDGMTVEEFSEYGKKHWSNIRKAIIEGRYQPSPVLRCFIPKSSGGERPLGIPTVTA